LEYIQSLNMTRGKEIELYSLKAARHEDLSQKPFIFVYSGRAREIIHLVNLIQQAGLNAEMPPDQQLRQVMPHFEMTFPREHLDKFMTVLHEWKTDI